jgi:cobaltochelatase CobN
MLAKTLAQEQLWHGWLVAAAALFSVIPIAWAADDGASRPALPRLAFVGLHGGVFDELVRLAPRIGVDVEFIKDERIAAGDVDFAPYQAVFLQHVRAEDREQYVRLLNASKASRPEQRIISISGVDGGVLAELARKGVVEYDPELQAYYGTSRENLRRLMVYVAVKYLGQSGDVLPPAEGDAPRGLYHPDFQGTFPSTEKFLAWAGEHGRKIDDIPRAMVTIHATHLAFQQPQVADALVREFEKQGVLAVAIIDTDPQYLAELKKFAPQVVIHTCHSTDSVAVRKELGIPHLSSIFFRQQSIDQWQPSVVGLVPSEQSFQIVGQELIGGIEPQTGAGTKFGGGSDEAFLPIPERIAHLVARAVAWIKLAQLPNDMKRVAVIYYDRELGKSELMRGSATGMFMNGPRSLVRVLRQMKQAEYGLTSVPPDEDSLLRLMSDHGRQIGIWAPGELDRLARGGKAVLIPAEQYMKWFETKVPLAQQLEVRARWGPAPGQFLVWENQGKQYIVVPRIELGNVILLPQPLRGEAHDTSLLHDKLVPPPHNYLATYFWLAEEFKANALIHFGTHGSEFILPGKPSGLSDYDWPDILLGHMPNINPWIINNLGESSPARRRAYAVLIDHLTPPSVNAELSDELLNLHNDIDHWVMLDDGALKDKFARSITSQVQAEHLDADLKLEITPEAVLTPPQIEQVQAYLHEIHNETTPVNLHVLGQPPRDDLLVPYLVTCLRKNFLESLGKVIEVPAGAALNEGDRKKHLRRKAEEVLELVVHRQYTPQEALAAVAGVPDDNELPKNLDTGFRLAARLVAGFARTPDEINNLLAALDGKFIPPGPGGSPDRNPGAVPSGRNMCVLNPEEVPSRPSWELGAQLVDQLLADRLAKQGHYPQRIAFTLSAFATFEDFGVMEAQIFYLLGVRPVWDEQNLVIDVELIPAAELGRPRIDVFIAGMGYYRDLLPTRMRLIDKAARLVAAENEKDNFVYAHTQQIAQELRDRGLPAQDADRLARARIFSYPPGQNGSAKYYYLVERSGHWDSREDLMQTYLDQVRYVYTEGMWGDDAPEAYERQIQGTEIVLRNWSDRTTSPLSNKYTWFHGGSLAAAVKYLTGKEPDFILTDVRDADDARMVSAEDALRKDFRVRLFNRKWIEGMMKEGYAGADQIAVHVSNTLGWKIMRPESVTDDQWQEIVDVYLRDSKQLSILEWFEAENPFALQEMHEVLLESIRKGYWQPSEEVVREIATGYAQSVATHGESGGLRGGDNTKLEAFVEKVLTAPGSRELNKLLAAYQAKAREAKEPAQSTAVGGPATPVAAAGGEAARTEPVRGQELVAATPSEPAASSAPTPDKVHWGLLLALACALLVGAGYGLRRGNPHR